MATMQKETFYGIGGSVNGYGRPQKRTAWVVRGLDGKAKGVYDFNRRTPEERAKERAQGHLESLQRMEEEHLKYCRRIGRKV